MVWYTSSKEAASPPLATQDSQLFAQSPQMGFISQKNLVCNVYYNILARLFPCEGSFRLHVRRLWSAAWQASWLLFYSTLTEAKICMNQMVSPKRGELVQLEIHLTWWPCRVVGGHLLAEPGRPLLLSLPSGGVWHKWQMWGGLGWLAGALLSVIPLPPPVTAIYFSFRIQHRGTTSRCCAVQDHASASSSNSSSLKPFPWSAPLVQTLGERKKKAKYSASTGLLATSSRSAFLRHCDFNCGCINTKWLHCSRRWWERELCILTALRQNFSGTATHQPTNPTQPALSFFLHNHIFHQNQEWS